MHETTLLQWISPTSCDCSISPRSHCISPGITALRARYAQRTSDWLKNSHAMHIAHAAQLPYAVQIPYEIQTSKTQLADLLNARSSSHTLTLTNTCPREVSSLVQVRLCASATRASPVKNPIDSAAKAAAAGTPGAIAAPHTVSRTLRTIASPGFSGNAEATLVMPSRATDTSDSPSMTPVACQPLLGGNTPAHTAATCASGSSSTSPSFAKRAMRSSRPRPVTVTSVPFSLPAFSGASANERSTSTVGSASSSELGA